MEHDVTVLPQSFMDWLCLKPRFILVKGVGRVHIAQTNLNGPAFNPPWSDAPGRWQVDGKVGDMNETLARSVALGPTPARAMFLPTPRGESTFYDEYMTWKELMKKRHASIPLGTVGRRVSINAAAGL